MNDFLPFQAEDINRWWRDQKGRGIFDWEVGTGKTFCARKIVAKFVKENGKILIIATNKLIIDYIKEFEKIGINLTMAWKRPSNCMITTYDRLSSFTKNDFDLVIADECHKIKNHTSTRGKLFRLIAQKSKYLLMMSGTLTNQRDPQEYLNYIWSINTWEIQLNFPKNITGFRKNYCYEKQVTPTFKLHVTDKRGAELIDSILQKYCSVKRKLRDIKEIPPMITENVFLDSKINMKASANAMEKVLGADININYGEGHISHILQMENGYDLFTKEFSNKAKFEAIVDILDSEPDKKFIIFSYWRAFTAELEKVLLRERIEYARIDAVKSNMNKAAQKVKEFKDNNMKVLILPHGTEGLNLQDTCSRIIFCNGWYDSIKYYQSIGRIERIGQQDKMVVYNLICDNSLEADVYDILKQKLSIPEAERFLIGMMQKRYGFMDKNKRGDAYDAKHFRDAKCSVS